MAAQEDEEEASEEPLVPGPSQWVQDLLNGGPVDLVDLEDEAPGWSCPLGDSFQVRGKGYLMDKLKVPAGDWLLDPLAFDWMKSTTRIDEVLRDPNNRVMSAIAEAREKDPLLMPFVLAINLQVPSKDNYSLVAYFVSTTPLPEGSLVDKFWKGDDDFRNSRLKLIANIVEGPWIVKTAVGDHAICILGKSLTCRYVQGENYLEVDVDIGSSMVANAIVHLAINYITTLTVDLAFLIEGRTEDELPEKLLGSVRFAHLELSAAVPVEVRDTSAIPTKFLSKEDEDSVEEDFDPTLEENAESLQSRIWKSFGAGLRVDWWGRQQL